MAAVATIESLLDASGFAVAAADGASAEDIELFEAVVGASAPALLRDFYTTLGAADCGPVRVLGLGLPVGHPADALDALAEAAPNPTPLFPLERRTGGRLAAATPEGTVLMIGPGDDEVIAPDVSNYLADRVAGLRHARAKQWERLRDMGTRFATRHHASETKVPSEMPRAHDWRPVRFCIQDVILGVLAMRFDRGANQLRVGPFVFTDVDGVPHGTGAEALTAIVVAEAYRCGGDLRVGFDYGVPDGMLRAAESLGVTLEHEAELAAAETRRLLVRLSRVGPALETTAIPDALAESISFQVLRSNWSALEVQLLLGCGDPGLRILAGGSPADWRLTRVEELELCRSALLAQALCSRVRAPDPGPSVGAVPDHEDAIKDVDVCVASHLGRATVVLEARESVALPWIRGRPAGLDAGERCVVLARGRGRAGIAAWAAGDAAEAADAAKRAGARIAAVLYPRDAEELDLQLVGEDTHVMVAPQPINALDRSVVARLRSASRDER